MAYFVLHESWADCSTEVQGKQNKQEFELITIIINVRNTAVFNPVSEFQFNALYSKCKNILMLEYKCWY